jgi:hypothetical protein
VKHLVVRVAPLVNERLTWPAVYDTISLKSTSEMPWANALASTRIAVPNMMALPSRMLRRRCLKRFLILMVNR